MSVLSASPDKPIAYCFSAKQIQECVNEYPANAKIKEMLNFQKKPAGRRRGNPTSPSATSLE